MCRIMFLVSLQVLLVKASWCINCENLMFPRGLKCWQIWKQPIKKILLNHNEAVVHLCWLKCNSTEVFDYKCSYAFPQYIHVIGPTLRWWCHIVSVGTTVWFFLSCFVLLLLQEISPPSAPWEPSSCSQIDEAPRQDSQRRRGCHCFSW